MSGMDENSDDPVVEEIDVFLSKALASQLYLIQYPLRPVYRPYVSRLVESARCKPKNQQLEMSLCLDTQSANYARSKGEQIAINVEGSTEDHQTFSSNMMDKHVLNSSNKVPDTSRYVIGCYRDRELHLTPMKGILQMKPSFSYLDSADKRQDEAAAQDEEAEEQEPEALPVMMKYARHESEEAKKRRMASYEHRKKEGEAESWVPLQHYECTESLAEAQRGLLLAPPDHNEEGVEFQVEPGEYLDSLMPLAKQASEERVALPNNVLSMTELKAMSLSEQVRALLLNARVMRFSQLMTLLSKGSDPTQTLRCLQQVALLVQGCWVVKSEVLHPKEGCSALTGVPAEALCRGRDYIMWRFTQSRCLVRKELSSVVKLPAEDVKHILEQMAKLKVNCGWEFRLEYDSEFVHRHPDVVQRQNMLWEAKFQQLSSVLSISKGDLKIAAQAAANAAVSPKRRRTASRSRSKSGCFSDDTDGESEKGRRRRRSSSSGEGRKRHSSGKKTEANNTAPVVSDPSLATNGGFVEPLAPNSVDPPANSSPEMDIALVTFVRQQMSARNVIPFDDLKLQLNNHLLELPPGHILGSGVSDKRIEMALVSSGCHRFQPTTPNGHPIYGLLVRGDDTDKVREVIARVVDSKKSFRLTVVKKNLEEAGIEIGENHLRALVKEYCVPRGSNYHLKGSFE